MDPFTVCHAGDLELFKTMDIPDINIQDMYGISLLITAIDCGHLEIAKFILSSSSISFPSLDGKGESKGGSKGLNVNIQDKIGHTALHVARRLSYKDGYPDIIKLLIDHGADVNARTSRGQTPIFILFDYNNNFESVLKITQYLISNGADINIQNNDGWTPLLGEVYNKNRKRFVDILLKYGSNPLIKNKYGKNAFNLNDDEDIIKILKDAVQEQNTPDVKGAL